MTKQTLRRLSPILFLTLFVALVAAPAGASKVKPVHPAAAANPDLGNSCGLDFLLVLDRSGSVAPSAATVKDAANAFLGAMNNTGSKAGVVSFADNAATDVAPALLTTGSLGGFTSAVNGLSFSGSTNWDAGLVKGRSLFSAYSGGHPDLVVVVTDGDPNRYVDDGNGSIKGPGSGFDQTSQDQAVLQANLMKAAGAHVFAVGVGDPRISALKAISGDDEWTSGAAFGTVDWTQVTGYNELKGKLADIATALCGGTVTVHKTLDGESGGAGWQFQAGDGDPQPTNGDGIATFSWNTHPVSVDLVEVDRPGYALESAACTINGDDPTGRALEGGGVHLEVGAFDQIRCTFNNVTLVPGLTLTKTAVNTDHPGAGSRAHPGDHILYTFTVTNTGEVPLGQVTVTDPRLDFTGTIGPLDPGHSGSVTAAYVVPDGQKADIVNTATACGSFAEQEDPACDTASHTLAVLNPAIHIDKSADPMSASPGDAVTYRYVVSNIGDVALSGVKVDDDVLGPIGTVASLAVGASATFDKTVTIDASSPGTNVATAAGTDPLGKRVNDTDEVTITVVLGETITTAAPPTTATTAAPAVTPAAPVVTPAPLPSDVKGNDLELPRTGTDPGTLLLPALALVIAGLILRAGNRRARRA